MRPKFQFVLAVLSLGFAVAASAAQSQSPAGVDYGDTVLVSAEQGQALADFVLQSGPRVRPKPDCSHLVHLLYARAGLVYPYEDSRVLYRGVDDFERVKTPQPGDLAVWLGHVGIVLSPEENMFLSSVRSGIITESWTAPHWARRGRPRFFRYRIGPSANLALLAAIMDDAVRNPAVRNRNEDARIAGAQTIDLQNEDSQNEDLRNADSRDEASRNGAASDAAIQDAEAPNEAARAPRTSREATLPRDDRRNTAADSAAGDSNVFVATLRQRKTPGKREIAAAILESANVRAQELTAGRTLNLDHPISVFDRVEILKIKVKHESGSVTIGSITIKLSETMSQEGGRVLAARMVEREFTMVRRRDGLWVISDPRRRTYLPQAQALAVFEYQAETFLRRAPNSSATRAVVKALDRLYDQQPGASQRASR